MSSKTRLAAFLAVLLVGAVSIVVAGCGGGSSSSSSNGTTSESEESTAAAGGGEEEESSGGGETLTVGSDIPYPPFEQGKKGSYTGFDVELMEAIGKEIEREPEFIDSSFETIFRDAEGFLTEGSFTNLFVERKNILLTPPLARGLLPGVLRARLIEEGRALEADLIEADLAEGFLIGNALRGLVRARFISPGAGAAS